MSELSISYFIERIEELRRDWPLLLADADIGQRLFKEVAGFGFDQAMRELLYLRQPAVSQPEASL